MQNDSYASIGSSIQEWIRGHRNLTILLSVVLFFMTIILPFTLNWALVFVSTQNKTGHASLKITYYTTADLKGSKRAKVYPLFGLLVIRRSDKILISQSDAQTETHSFLNNIRWLGVKKISAVHMAQKKILPLGVGGFDCVVGDDKKAFSYNCGSPDELDLYERPNPTPGSSTLSWQSTSQNGITLKSNTRPYLDGLIQISDGTTAGKTTLSFIRPGALEKNRVLQLPSNIAQDKVDFEYLSIFTDTVHAGNTRFVVSDVLNKRLYIFRSLDDTEPQRIELPREGAKISLGENQQQLGYSYAQFAQVINDTTYYYSGILSVPLDNPDYKTNEVKPKAIKGLATVGKVTDTQKTEYKNSDFTGIDGFWADGNGELYASDADSLAQLKPNDNTKSFLLASFGTGVSSPIATPQGLLYTTSQGLFKYDPARNSSYLVFKSKRLNAGTVTSSNNRIFMTTVIANDKQDQSLQLAYEIFNEDFKDKTRIEDIIPYPRNELPVDFITYDRNRIYASIIFENITSDAQTGKTTVDPAEYSSKTALVRNALQRDGILKEGDKLLFNYYPQ